MKITKGKYYKSKHNNVIVKATTSDLTNTSFSGIMVENDDNSINPLPKEWLNNDIDGWISKVFVEIKYKPKKVSMPLIKINSFPIL